MPISVISDIHIKESSDDRMNFLKKFMANNLVQESETIIFLGDIFDLMVGSYKEYIEVYRPFFDFVKIEISKGKEIYFLEGNHDFHLKDMFDYFLRSEEINSANFIYSTTGFIKVHNDKKYFFSHGDDIEIGNYSYKIYRKIIGSRFIKILTDDLVPYSIVDYIGTRASKASRKRNKEKYEENTNSEYIKNKFRESAKKARKNILVDYFICGHSHVKDEFKGENFVYMNNGFAINSSSFIYIDEEPRFIDL